MNVHPMKQAGTGTAMPAVGQDPVRPRQSADLEAKLRGLRERRRAPWIAACRRAVSTADPSARNTRDERQLTTAERHARDLDYARKLLAGDPAALESLPVRLACLPAMVRYQNRRLGEFLNATDIEDAVRDTIAALWIKLPQFEGRSTLETWVYRFAFLEVLKAVQEKCRMPQPLDREESLHLRGLESDDCEPSAFDPKDLTEGLARLKHGAAEVIKQRHFEEQSFEAIAARNHTGVNTVKARYYRGLAQLKAVLERKVRREGV